jgi:hypothetical protein
MVAATAIAIRIMNASQPRFLKLPSTGMHGLPSCGR